MKNVNDAPKLIAVIYDRDQMIGYFFPPAPESDRAAVRAAAEIVIQAEYNPPPDVPILVVFWDERPTTKGAE